ncbi:MAG: murein biosynthesis integral membrane protein MurJ [Verrucomicrobia bacterium]|jgi:putative peptidoglycan lipid II flippase|nr:murein biosynthesis integral membrane protein MurJ [Verrucomicrobiota bacterium]
MSIFKHTRVVSMFTAASRLLGFLREVLMAHFFGTTLAKSAFDIAFKFPNLFRRLFGEGALSAAFVPVFAETLEQEGSERARQLSGRVATLLATVLLMITIGTVAVLSLLLNYGTFGPKAAAILPLLRIMFPYMFFICMVALCMGILNAMHRFALPAATPVLLNVAWIAALFLLCPRFGDSIDMRIFGVAWGILIAGVIQLAVQVPALLHCKMWPQFSFRWGDPQVRRVLLLMGPAAVGMGIHQINVVIDGFLAIWVGTWAPAALTYAERLIYLPLGIFATALSTVLLPTFSRQAARAELAGIATTMADSIRGLMLIMVPASIGLMVLTTPIVRLAFEWTGGRFDETSTIVTARALWFYAPGLIVFSLYKILVPAFYALKDTRTPVRIGIRAVLANLVLNVVFVLTWPDGFEHAGLACATVLASGLNCLALAVIITHRIGSPGWRSLGWSFLRTAFAALLMAVAVLAAQRLLPVVVPGLNCATKLGQLATVGICMVLGIGVYFGAALTLCRSECRALMQHKSNR